MPCLISLLQVLLRHISPHLHDKGDCHLAPCLLQVAGAVEEVQGAHVCCSLLALPAALLAAASCSLLPDAATALVGLFLAMKLWGGTSGRPVHWHSCLVLPPRAAQSKPSGQQVPAAAAGQAAFSLSDWCW
jgi:hypothetical protein